MTRSDLILDTVVELLDTAPEFTDNPDLHLKFLERVTGENATVRMQKVEIGDETYLVVASRVGG